MIDDWDIPAAPKTAQEGPPLRVAAIVPLPSALGGSGEILVLSAFGTMKLPTGDIQSRETSFRAVSRIALGTTGVRVTPERLVYVIEQAGRSVTLCVLCSLVEDDDPDTRPGVKFASVESSDSELEPTALRELLIEDVRAGFVRPVAHVVVRIDDEGRERVDVNW